MWLFPKRAKLPLIGLDQIALAAVADAISPKPEAIDFKGVHIEQMPDGGSRVSLSSENFVIPDHPAPESFEPVGVIIRNSEPVITTHLSPEYHAGLAARMIESLDADDARLTEAIATEISQHETLLAALHAELAGVRKVREAYSKVGETLADTSVAAVPFPQGVVAEVKNGSVRFTKPRRRKPVEPVTE